MATASHGVCRKSRAIPAPRYPARPVRRLAVVLSLAAAVAPAQQKPAADDPAKAFFARQPIVRVRIDLPTDQREKLRQSGREYATAALRIDDKAFAAVGVKLKGAAGSYREIDDRPGFTVHLGKAGGDERFHGLQKFHLNNGAQDDTRLHEWLGNGVFAAAGLPAPRVAHAHVWLDGQDLGLYAFREAFDGEFLDTRFGGKDGNLYDGGFCQDVDQPLQKDAGKGVDDRADLERLCRACQGVDPRREAALQTLVDVERYVDFLALEAMLGHWDGYSRNMNNYRLWLPRSGPAVFLPHGMDQLFGDSDASVLDHPPAIVASAVLQIPAWRKRYRERLKALLPLFAPDKLVPPIKQLGDKLARELRTTDPDGARAHEEAVRGLADRVTARYRVLEQQVKAPDPKPLPLAAGKPLLLKNWRPAAETEGLELVRKAAGGAMALQVAVVDKAAEPRRGLWRMHVLLAKGRYELRATARCDGVALPPKDQDGNQHGGALVRADGAASERLDGDRGWQPLVAAFEVGEFQRTVGLELDLHALAGKAAFRADSLQLVRLPD
jgi:spore coat protein H